MECRYKHDCTLLISYDYIESKLISQEGFDSQVMSRQHGTTREHHLRQTMIRVYLKKLLDEKSFSERRRITLNEVSEETKISRATLTRIANTPGYNTNTDTINTLCKYFKCAPGELLGFVEDDEEKRVM